MYGHACLWIFTTLGAPQQSQLLMWLLGKIAHKVYPSEIL